MSLCLRAFLANRVHGLTNLGHSSPSQFLFIMQSDKPVFQFQRVNLGERLLPAPPCRGLLGCPLPPSARSETDAAHNANQAAHA